jgi:hypothetical protein
MAGVILGLLYSNARLHMKLAVCLLAFILAGLIASSAVAGGYTMGPVRWGDSDCDNNVTVGDVVYVLKYLGGVPDPPPPSALCPTIGSFAPVIN